MIKFKVYLAGPIGKMTLAEANQWRTDIAYQLGSFGIATRNPLRGKVESERNDYTNAEIVIRDKNDIANCDLVLVNWPERGISNGTAMEILYAFEHEKPILFAGKWGQDDRWLQYHVTRFFDGMDDAVDYALQMFINPSIDFIPVR